MQDADKAMTDPDVDEVLRLAMAIRAINWDDPNDLENLLIEKIFPITGEYDIIRSTDLFTQLDPRYSRFGWFKIDLAMWLLRSFPEPVVMDYNTDKWQIYRFPLARMSYLT